MHNKFEFSFDGGGGDVLKLYVLAWLFDSSGPDTLHRLLNQVLFHLNKNYRFRQIMSKPTSADTRMVLYQGQHRKEPVNRRFQEQEVLDYVRLYSLFRELHKVFESKTGHSFLSIINKITRSKLGELHEGGINQFLEMATHLARGVLTASKVAAVYSSEDEYRAWSEAAILPVKRGFSPS